MLNQTLKVYRDSFSEAPAYRSGRLTAYGENTLRSLNRYIWVIGAKADWHADGTFSLTDTDRMVANLRRWQANH